LNPSTAPSYIGLATRFTRSASALVFRDTFTLDRVGNRSMLLHEISDREPGYQYGPYFLPRESTESRFDANDRILSDSWTHVTWEDEQPVAPRFTAYTWGDTGQSSGLSEQQIFEGESNARHLVSTTTYTYDSRGRMSQSAVITPAPGTPGRFTCGVPPTRHQRP
jgi:hypothetical protein